MTPVRPASSAGLWQRLAYYQAVRFALAGFVPLVTAFAFSSAAYSRVVRGEPGFVPLPRFLVGALTALVFFFMLRVLDEHKDEDVDLRSRPELPVPSGIVTLRELRIVGSFAVAATLIANAIVAPRLLLAYAGVAFWAALMTREFFVREWLRAHPTAYLVTHMAIMPMIDLYTTGLDWLAEGARLPHGLGAFLAVTFFNGVLIEVGRKMRTPADERAGVDTYTRAWGLRRAPVIWLLTLAASAGAALIAARGTATLSVAAWALVPVAALCAVPALAFALNATRRAATWAERSSQMWPLVTYLVLGATPYVLRSLAARP